MSLNIRKYFDEDKELWIVELEGEIDIYTSNNLKESLLCAFGEKKGNIILDATKLDYIDSTGLGILIGILKTLKKSKNEICIINPKKNVKKIFNITGLDKIFKVEG